MNWSEFYLVCFFFGFGLSVLSLLGGSAHVHLPHLHLPHGAHIGHGGAPWFNLATIAAFLAWFGGTGYLLEHYYSVWFVLALGISIVSGIGASAVVFWFLAQGAAGARGAARPGRLRYDRRAGQVEHAHPRRRHG